MIDQAFIRSFRNSSRNTTQNVVAVEPVVAPLLYTGPDRAGGTDISSGVTLDASVSSVAYIGVTVEGLDGIFDGVWFLWDVAGAPPDYDLFAQPTSRVDWIRGDGFVPLDVKGGPAGGLANPLNILEDPSSNPRLGYVADGVHELTVVVGASNGDFWTYTYPITIENASVTPTDSVAPLVGLTSPVNSSVVGGVITLAADATDAGGMDYVRFDVGGSPVATVTEAPWTTTFDTTGVADGSLTISAYAFDLAGNSASDSITVTVLNSGVPAPSPRMGWAGIGRLYANGVIQGALGKASRLNRAIPGGNHSGNTEKHDVSSLGNLAIRTVKDKDAPVLEYESKIDQCIERIDYAITQQSLYNEKLPSNGGFGGAPGQSFTDPSVTVDDKCGPIVFGTQVGWGGSADYNLNSRPDSNGAAYGNITTANGNTNFGGSATVPNSLESVLEMAKQAAGGYDADFTTAANDIYNYTFNGFEPGEFQKWIILRPGYEHNGHWFQYYSGTDTTLRTINGADLLGLTIDDFDYGDATAAAETLAAIHRLTEPYNEAETEIQNIGRNGDRSLIFALGYRRIAEKLRAVCPDIMFDLNFAHPGAEPSESAPGGDGLSRYWDVNHWAHLIINVIGIEYVDMTGIDVYCRSQGKPYYDASTGFPSSDWRAYKFDAPGGIEETMNQMLALQALVNRPISIPEIGVCRSVTGGGQGCTDVQAAAWIYFFYHKDTGWINNHNVAYHSWFNKGGVQSGYRYSVEPGSDPKAWAALCDPDVYAGKDNGAPAGRFYPDAVV